MPLEHGTAQVSASAPASQVVQAIVNSATSKGSSDRSWNFRFKVAVSIVMHYGSSLSTEPVQKVRMVLCFVVG